jgi:hypothetical protein
MKYCLWAMPAFSLNRTIQEVTSINAAGSQSVFGGTRGVFIVRR